jgi:hypothetical protein
VVSGPAAVDRCCHVWLVVRGAGGCLPVGRHLVTRGPPVQFAGVVLERSTTKIWIVGTYQGQLCAMTL